MQQMTVMSVPRSCAVSSATCHFPFLVIMDRGWDGFTVIPEWKKKKKPQTVRKFSIDYFHHQKKNASYLFYRHWIYMLPENHEVCTPHRVNCKSLHARRRHSRWFPDAENLLVSSKKKIVPSSTSYMFIDIERVFCFILFGPKAKCRTSPRVSPKKWVSMISKYSD